MQRMSSGLMGAAALALSSILQNNHGLEDATKQNEIVRYRQKSRKGRDWNKSKAKSKRHNVKHTPSFHPRGKYTPGGSKANVNGTYVKCSAQAAQMNKMHDAWFQKKFGGA